MTYPDGRRVSYSYDSMNRMTKVIGLDGEETCYSYDAAGRRTEATSSTLTTAYSYDDIGNLLAQVTTGEREIAYRYSYNRNGNITGEVRTEGDTTTESTYAYDALGQLTSFMQSTGYGESYTYDKVGNMTKKVISGMDGEKVALSMAYNKGNQMVGMSNGRDKIAYSYDKNGSMVKKVLTSRTYGKLTDSYSYNSLDQLTSYTGYDGYQQQFTYDANGMRLSKSEKGNANRSTLEELLRGNVAGLPEVIAPNEAEEDYNWATTEYLYDITAEYYQVIQKNTADETTVYEYGLERIAEYTNNAKHSYVYDGRGSVVLGAGYTPFGDQMGTVKVDGYGYNAEDYDVATGMLNLRARQYEPAMNRFSVKDIYPSNPLVGASFNSYVYTYNNPVGFVDANGLSASSLRKVLTTTGHTLQSAATAAGATAAVASVLIGTSVVNAVTGRVQSALKIAATQASKNRTTPKVSAAQKASGAAAQAKQQLTASNKVQRESVTQTTGGIIASCSGYKAAQTKSAEEFISELLNATVKVEKGVVLSTDKNAAGRLVMPAGTYTPQEFIMYVNQNGDEQARRELTSAISAGKSVETALQSYIAMHKETATLSAWKPGIVDEIQMEIKRHQGHPEYAINQAYQLLLEPHVERYMRIVESENVWEALRNIENFLLMGMVDDSHELLYGEGNSAVKVGIGANLLMKAFSFGGGWEAVKKAVTIYPTTEELISYGNHVAPWYGGGQYGDIVPAGTFNEAFSSYKTLLDDRVTVVTQQKLPENIANTFKDGKYRTVITNEDITVYRVFGGNAEAGGGFATTIPAENRIQVKIHSALLPIWKNTRQYEATIIIPKGTVINIGKVEQQSIVATGTILEGGADQILLPMGWDLSWISEIHFVESR